MSPSFGLSILLLLLTSAYKVLSCGYSTCPQISNNSSQLHLHIIAHSHDDVGWLTTPDGYADGDVNPLLTAVTDALLRDLNRRFVQVEMYYFKRWWQRQSADVQQAVHRLVHNGQLTFAGGGWCVADEATTHYTSFIDQMKLGIDFLRGEFGDCAVPKLSWQIDPFGASREAANLFAMMGFEGHVTNRGNEQLFGEFLWNTSSSGRQIFTTRMHHHYHAPDGFNFEDHDEITEANKHAKAKALVELGRKWNRDYGSKGHVLLTFGHDMAYKHAERWFSNLDKLIEAVNRQYPDVHLHYSSPHCYLQAVRSSKAKLEVKSGDFFPYWTGYFTSRPQVKYLDRFAGNLLVAAKQLEVLAELDKTQGLIYEARNEIGVLQHHDAITGTSRPNVMFDYKQRLVNSIRASAKVISTALGKLSLKSGSNNYSFAVPAIYTTVNISDFVHLTSDAFVAIVYNPLGQVQQSWIRIPVKDKTKWRILDSTLVEVKNASTVPINDKVKSMVGHHAEVTQEIVFNVTLPALGFTTYFLINDHGVQGNSTTTTAKARQTLDTDTNQNFILKGKDFELLVDHKSGDILHLKKANQTHRLSQKFAYYTAKHSSDSYQFCPTKGATDLNHNATTAVVHAAKYNGFVEVTQKVRDWIWQTIRVYEDKEYVELDWIVGPVDDSDGVSKEVIMRFETALKSNGTWYTDANGRQDIRRQRDPKPHSCGPTQQTFSFNYYPATSRASIRDELNPSGHQLTVLPDRSVGVASMADGSLELMLHRRLLDHLPNSIDLNDLDGDGKGVVARGKVLLVLSSKEEAAEQTKQLTKQIFGQPVLAFRPFVKNRIADYTKILNVNFSGLKTPLPENVHLLSLEAEGRNATTNEILVRLEHLYEPTDHSKEVIEAKFNLDNFSRLKIHSVDKVNLLGIGPRTSLKSHDISLAPAEIGTYLLAVNRSSLSRSPSCHLKWEPLKSGKLPMNAVLGGHEPGHNSTSSPLHICRHTKSAEHIPGKYGSSIHCRISNGGQELIFNDEHIEILTDSAGTGDYQWVPRHGGDAVPDGAFVAGHAHGVPIYVGRCAKNGLVVGKIDAYFYYAYGRKEHKDCVDHEILTC